jgi:hypothetical protein
MTTLVKWLATGLVCAALGLTSLAMAQGCDANCNSRCTPEAFGVRLPPEPSCVAECEVQKRAACERVTLPPLPPHPVEIHNAVNLHACGEPFRVLTRGVIAQCSNWDGRIDNQVLIDNAANKLMMVNAMQPNELAGIQVRWCPLSNAVGITPEASRIYLDTSLVGNPQATAAVLAHELTHIRQYRRQTSSDEFACRYSEAYVACNGCQDDRHPLEREAYAFEADVRARLDRMRSSPPPIAAPQTTDGRGSTCKVAIGLFSLDGRYILGDVCTVEKGGQLFVGTVLP